MKKPEILQTISNEEEKQILNISTEDFEITDSLITCNEDIDKKTVPYIERMVRNSIEYRNYIRYLREELDMSRCSFLEGLDSNDVGISLEFHHFPMNLYEISEAVLKSKIDNLTDSDNGVSLFDVTEEVIKEHYLNEIGLVPLSKTLHEMAHNRSIVIPISKVYGNYRNFLNKYGKYISDEIKARISDDEVYNESNDVKEFNDNKLIKRISNYKVSYDSKEESDSELDSVDFLFNDGDKT